MLALLLNYFHLRRVFDPARTTLFSVGTEPLLPLKDGNCFRGGGPEDFKLDFLFLAGAAAFLEVVGRHCNKDGEGARAVFLAFFPFGAADQP